MRRLPPRDVKNNLAGLTVLRPELTEEFLQRVDQPLETRVDASTKKRYILCDYNRDGDSFRSPWSNVYDPALPDGFLPSTRLRDMEVAANEVFDVYRELYYEQAGSASSVYFWELDDEAFASCWLIKKELGAGRFVSRGCWDAIHVVEAKPNGGTWSYKLTTTVLLSLAVDKPESETGALDLSGSLTRQAMSTLAVSPDKDHIANVGGLIESMEADLRGAMDSLYIAKTKEIVAGLHSRQLGGPNTTKAFVSNLASAVAGLGLRRMQAGGAGSS